MIQNIPNVYSQSLIMNTIVELLPEVEFNFLYVPTNPRNRRNVGYAFINFVAPQHIIPFHSQFHGKTWLKSQSVKVCAIAYARVQGISALREHFRSGDGPDRKVKPMFGLDSPVQLQ